VQQCGLPWLLGALGVSLSELAAFCSKRLFFNLVPLFTTLFFLFHKKITLLSFATIPLVCISLFLSLSDQQRLAIKLSPRKTIMALHMFQMKRKKY
jgi:hypothetical protein